MGLETETSGSTTAAAPTQRSHPVRGAGGFYAVEAVMAALKQHTLKCGIDWVGYVHQNGEATHDLGWSGHFNQEA